MTKKKAQTKRPPFYRRKGFLWTIGSVVGLILFILVWFRVSPWPGAMIIRAVFENNGSKVSKALEAHAPATPMTVLADRQYRMGDKDALLDVYYRQDTKAKQPVVIWTHGGAWLSGDKLNNSAYYKLLAEKGYTVISLNYSLAPEKQYPQAIHQLNDAYRYIQDNAGSLNADTSQIVLAGDSAGAQMSSQMAAITTNPAYAKEVGVVPALKPAQLRAVVLFCGIYNMRGLATPDSTLPKIVGWGDDVSVWAITGTRDFENDPSIGQMSSINYLTKDFPPAFISGGNADPLTDAQSKPLVEKLTSLGVSLTTLFYPADHQPGLPHEYQFNLDNQDGKTALSKTLNFLEGYAKKVQ